MQQPAIIEEFGRLNRNYSDRFVAEARTRRSYRKTHQVEFGFLPCMDGRDNVPLACGLPVGVSQSWNTAGHVVDLSPSSAFLTSLYDWYECVVRRQNRRCVFAIVPHWSQTDIRLGCKAHDFRTAEAQGQAIAQARQLAHDFGLSSGGRRLHPVVWALETDRQALTFRKLNGSARLDVSSMLDLSPDDVIRNVIEFYEDEIGDICVIEAIAKDIVLGNMKAIRRMNAGSRSAEMLDHGESALCWGRGFEWITESAYNKALILDHFDPDPEKNLRIAAEILLANLTVRRTIPKRKGVILIVSLPFRSSCSEPAYNLAQSKAVALYERAMKVIRRECPDLLPFLHCMVGVVETDTRRFKAILRGPVN